MTDGQFERLVTVTGETAKYLVDRAGALNVTEDELVYRALAIYAVVVDAVEQGFAVSVTPEFDDIDLPQLLRIEVRWPSGDERQLVQEGLMRWPPTT